MQNPSDHNSQTPSPRGGVSLIPPQCRVMAQGICHRVKNDLQTISNLLTLAGPYAASPAALVQAVEERIGALSLPYTLFSENAADVTLDCLGREVAQKVSVRFTHPVTIKNQLPQAALSLRLCSILSLWLHEMLNNACLHGLAQTTAPMITLKGEKGTNNFIIVVQDNGKGLPANFVPIASHRLGLRLAFGLAEMDLNGKLELIPTSPGLMARLTVPAREFDRLNQNAW